MFDMAWAVAFVSTFVLVSASNLIAQSPRDNSARPVVQTGAGSIRGRIVALDTGKPLSRARITLSAPELGPDGRLTSTNGDGRYEINDLPAARYTLSVSRNGYLPLRFGQRRPLEQGIPLELESNQQLDHVDFALPPAAAISGRITDENGDPVVGTNVWVMRSAYLDGRRQWITAVASGFLATDDAGEYRVSGLNPGTYRVLAWTRESWTRADDGKSVTMAYAPAYFPGTTSASDAQTVTVKLGQDVINTDFSFTAGRAASISGTAFDSRGRPLQFVALAQQIGDITSGFGGTPVKADGSFTLQNVAPGQYTLMGAASPSAERPEGASVPVEIDGTDLEGITLTASPGWSVSGSVRASDGQFPPFSRDSEGLQVRPVHGLERPSLGQLHQGLHKPIISRDLFARVQDVFAAANHSNVRSRGRTGSPVR
jgi:protocatechuate 3,4-dioxygenase beta subunit